jgi:hypothetical protein
MEHTVRCPSVPEAVLNQDQRRVTVATHPGVPEPRLCILFRWVEGRFLDRVRQGRRRRHRLR